MHLLTASPFMLSVLPVSNTTAKFTSAVATRPHIAIILADDLGWNDVSFHGSMQIPTPEIDALARKGVIFDQYYVQPVCSPTRASLLTGRHVIHTSIYDPDCSLSTTLAVPTNFTMLPAHLKRLGYETAAVGYMAAHRDLITLPLLLTSRSTLLLCRKWHLGMFAPDVLPTGRGFDTFFGYYGGAEDYFEHSVGKYKDIHDDKGADLKEAKGLDGQYSTFLYTARAVSIIESFAARRLHPHGEVDAEDADVDEAAAAPPSLFLYLAYQAIHSPDEAPASYIDRFITTIPDTPDGVGQHRRKVTLLTPRAPCAPPYLSTLLTPRAPCAPRYFEHPSPWFSHHSLPRARQVAGMITALDEGVGNVTRALDAAGMASRTLIVFR